LAAATESVLPDGCDHGALVTDVRPLGEAGAEHVSFVDNRKYLSQLSSSRAGACFVAAAFQARVPATCVALVSRSPYRSFALALTLFYPEGRSSRVSGLSPGVDPSARLEPGVVVEAGATVGPEAWIGSGTRITAGAVVGYRCTIGRDSYIGAGATVLHALLGNRVIIHPGVRIGQDGFGFAMGARHLKVPQIGRVIIQDDVEIGANSCIDRGALKDTIIGEGTKIDNLVQIGHNVVVGRHCVIVGQVGIAGSAELGDYVVMGGQSGVVGHVKIGSGAKIAGGSHAKDDLAPGAQVIGTPAKPIKEWMREQLVVRQLASRGSKPGAGETET
jgi:UDP-3-O-[3-hydroxymyristoyl] glucosamine N-acyltransferase